VASLPLTGLARELAANCVLREARADRIQLVLAPEHGQLLTPGVLEKLEEALRSVFRRRLRVAVEIESPPEDTPAMLRKREDENRRAEAVEAIEGNAVVQDLCKTFGTKVDPELVQPVSNPKGVDI
jgi:DNA polymerase-3 subunit gamma/tau